jgi:magnesium-transporting ATPase (P-type)
MYPKPIDFRFTKDFFKFVGVLSIIAAIGFVYAIIIMHSQDAPFKKVIIRALDLITIVIPPALPAAMTIGIVAAQVSYNLNKYTVFR